MGQGSELIALARSKAGQWYYTNDSWARLHPEESGGTDCSGFVRWCYGKFGYNVGSWTGDESYAGYEIARGHYPSEIPWDDMQPGDLILMTATYWNDYTFSHYLCHIELYCGNGTMIGHPSGYGPQEKWAQAWMQSYGCITWMVRRVFEGDDDMQPVDVWAYKNKDLINIDAYQELLDVHKQLTRTDNAGWSTPNGHDIYGRVNSIQKDVTEMKSAISKLQVGNASIDYDKLANKVADVIYARMKA